MVRKTDIVFNTCIVTYPSDYDGLLNTQLIMQKFDGIRSKSTKIVICREDADEEIQRNHWHCYWDDEKRKQVSTKYFDIKLPEPVVVFILDDTRRHYQLYSDLASELGIDTYEEMAPKIEKKIELENGIRNDVVKGKIIKWEYLDVAHPNIQLKKEYGDKYFMLRYVTKRIHDCHAFANFDVDKELKYLQDNCELLCDRVKKLYEENLLRELNMKTVEELIYLLKKYKMKKMKKDKNQKNNVKKGRPSKTSNELSEDARDFRDWLRPLVIECKLTKKEVINEITKSSKWWEVFSSNYINYTKLITDMFRGRPPAKPTRHYDFKFYLPNKLYDYLMWLDDWVMKWHTGKPLEHRPKGLVIIGPSRTGKTSLISCMGDFSYFKNIWSLDCWEGKTPFTVMDDMDAGDEGKGLSFCWYKPFFGAQDAITVTDKFKPKEDIVNGKPLIWLNNYRIDETFQSKTAQDYILKNMEIVYINKPLSEPPTGMDIFQYKEFDPKTTWYYINVVNANNNEENLVLTPETVESVEIVPNNVTLRINEDDIDDVDFKLPSPVLEMPQPENNGKIIKFIDETEKIIEKCEDEEPLSQRKHRLHITNFSEQEKFEIDKGRPSKIARRES